MYKVTNILLMSARHGVNSEQTNVYWYKKTKHSYNCNCTNKALNNGI